MKIQLYIDTANTSISVKSCLFLIKNKKIQRQISPQRIDTIAITSNVQLNTAAIKLAAANDISIFIYDNMGRSVGQFRSPNFTKHSELRYKQLLFMNSFAGKEWAKQQLLLKTKQQLQSVNRWKRKFANANQLESIANNMREFIKKIEKTQVNSNKINGTLMGYEGSVAKLYYKAVNLIIPSEYQFKKRSRRPGKDYYNVVINYIYGITYNEITRALQSAGLDPFCGTLHKTQYGETLVFDFIEPFRPIVDRLLINQCMENIWNATHFTKITGGYKLNAQGKKILLPSFSDYMYQRIKWLDKVTFIRNHIFLHARKLKLLIENYKNDVPNIL